MKQKVTKLLIVIFIGCVLGFFVVAAIIGLQSYTEQSIAPFIISEQSEAVCTTTEFEDEQITVCISKEK